MDWEIFESFLADGNPSAYFGWEVARSSFTNPNALIALASDKDASIRFEVARNSATPDEVLAKLAGDSNRNVRLEAQASLANRANR